MNQLAIVICTSNSYADFINIFLYFFRKNFKTNIEVKLYVVGITKHIQIEGIVCLPSSLDENASWSNRVIDGLSQISEKNILLLTEDILFTKSNKNISFDEIFDLFISNEFDYLRLSPFPAPTKKLTKLYGEVSPYIIHRVSMQPSLWKYEFLMSIIKKNESIWEFEVKGSRRSRISNKIMALNSYFIPYEEVISRGKITRKGYNLLKSENLHNQINFELHTYNKIFVRKLYYFLVMIIGKMNIFRKYIGV
ncbi:hypothetical protein O8C83_06425 [Aliarcobacter butzleri]|uniref:hypothetical protein n=1 Tax=Aliarcobacter butzleri TaxID=28197 RepID=UPI00263D99A4|nr:hypothetical protein [Aliarcobacter butzleri]MDN5100455.1 hypothetical protein [Aliarcobacter butzleri]